jgi:hypothetical protein
MCSTKINRALLIGRLNVREEKYGFVDLCLYKKAMIYLKNICVVNRVPSSRFPPELIKLYIPQKDMSAFVKCEQRPTTKINTQKSSTLTRFQHSHDLS